MTKQNVAVAAAAVDASAVLLGMAKLADTFPIVYKEGTSRQIIAPNEELRNRLAVVCADNAIDYNHVIAILRSMVAGESSNGTVESMSDAEVFKAFAVADKAYSRLLDARKEYKQSKKMPEGFTLEDFLNIDEVAAERQRLLKLKSRRESDALKAAEAAKAATKAAASPNEAPEAQAI